jgi:hypothetical protein
MAKAVKISQKSSISRVTPVFQWLERNADPTVWPRKLLEIVHGFEVRPDAPGALKAVTVGENGEGELKVDASCARLAWMIRNAGRLAPSPRKAKEYLRLVRVQRHAEKEFALGELAAGRRPFGPKSRSQLRLEGATSADCLVECERALIWIEGKRNDWLSTCTDWDVLRDQLARNVEAAWLLAQQVSPKHAFYFVLCYEGVLKHHEQLLIDGYRQGTWAGGWLHLALEVRSLLAARIGTVTWGEIVNTWPRMLEEKELQDIDITVAEKQGETDVPS